LAISLVVKPIVAEVVVIGATVIKVISGGVVSITVGLAAVVKEWPQEFTVLFERSVA
jgi:K+ transporter